MIERKTVTLICIAALVLVSVMYALWYEHPPSGPCPRCDASGRVVSIRKHAGTGKIVPVEVRCRDCDGDGDL